MLVGAVCLIDAAGTEDQGLDTELCERTPVGGERCATGFRGAGPWLEQLDVAAVGVGVERWRYLSSVQLDGDSSSTQVLADPVQAVLKLSLDVV